MGKIKNLCIPEQQAALHDEFVAMEDENGWFINRYFGTARSTFADNLTEKEAKSLTRILNKYSDKIWR